MELGKGLRQVFVMENKSAALMDCGLKSSVLQGVYC
jgi:hypothetical protein